MVNLSELISRGVGIDRCPVLAAAHEPGAGEAHKLVGERDSAAKSMTARTARAARAARAARR